MLITEKTKLSKHNPNNLILYKYVTLNGANEMLLNYKSLLFSKPSEFNDPFDSVPKERSKGGMFEEIGDFDDYILCLTRAPSNLLMWSHYSDEHTGVVVGLDLSQIPELEKNCIIPVSKGDLIYTSTRPNKNLTHKKYLYKSLEWAYEEEVRIVKHGQHLDQCPIYNKKSLSFNTEAVVEIFFGCRITDKGVTCEGQYYDNLADIIKLKNKLKQTCSKALVKFYRPSDKYWGLEEMHDNEVIELEIEEKIFREKGMNGLYEYWDVH